jgi:hypothetical protein
VWSDASLYRQCLRFALSGKYHSLNGLEIDEFFRRIFLFNPWGMSDFIRSYIARMRLPLLKKSAVLGTGFGGFDVGRATRINYLVMSSVALTCVVRHSLECGRRYRQLKSCGEEELRMENRHARTCPNSRNKMQRDLSPCLLGRDSGRIFTLNLRETLDNALRGAKNTGQSSMSESIGQHL